MTEVSTSMFDFDKNMSDDLEGKICFSIMSDPLLQTVKKYKNIRRCGIQKQ